MLKHFGSLKRLRAATVDEVVGVPGVGRRTAEAVVAALADRRPEPAVNTATGEILDDTPDRAVTPAAPPVVEEEP